MKPFNYLKSLYALNAADFFEIHFSDEILKSERIRCLMLAGIFFFATFWFYTTNQFLPDLMPRMFSRPHQGYPFLYWVSLVLLAGAVYEILFFLFLGRLIKKNLRLPAPPRYGNAFIEVSIPTTIMFFSAGALNDFEALMLPTPYYYFIFIALSALRLSFMLSLYTGLIASAQYLILALIIVPGQAESATETMFSSPGLHIAKGLLILLSGAITGFAAHQIKLRIQASLQTLEERNRIVGIFGRHVSPQVVEKLISSKKDSETEVRHVCVMFLDIRGFTRFTEGREPGEVISYLNYLFEFMIEIVNSNNGIINKFLGDGFMAVFGAPLSDGRDIPNAVKASLEILARLDREAREGNIPETRIGIGLHSGEAITGNVGSQARQEYTVIGDVVNLASRIEGLNKRFGSQFLVSDEVWKEVTDRFPDSEDLGEVEIRGLAKPVRIRRLA